MGVRLSRRWQSGLVLPEEQGAHGGDDGQDDAGRDGCGRRWKRRWMPHWTQSEAGDSARVEALLEPVHPADIADLLEQIGGD